MPQVPEIGSKVRILPHEGCIHDVGKVEAARRAYDQLKGIAFIIICERCGRGGMMIDAAHPLPASYNGNPG